MIGFYSEGTYDADGNFNTYEEVLDPRSVACGYVPTGNVTFSSNNSDALFSVPGKGVYAPNQTVNNWSLGNYTYTVRSEGNAEQSGSFYLGEAGQVVSAEFPNPVSLPGQDGPSYEEKPHVPSDDVYYEAVLTDPLSYRVVDRAALGGAFNFTYTESYRSFSAFSFSLKGTVREFEDLISLDSGRAGILLYVNGVQRIQGLIQNYSPSGEGFITVNCSEILAGLDDAWSGKLDLNNILFEYIPSETGIEASTDLATLYEYWNKGFGKSNFFFTPGINNYSRVGETSEGVVVPEGSTNDLYIRPFSSRNFFDYTLHIKGLGKPFSRLYLSSSVYIQFTGNSFDLMSNGSILRSTGSIDTYTVGGGSQPLIDSLSNAEVYYKALVTPTGIEFQVRVKYLGVFKEYNIPFTYLTLGPSDVHLSLGNGAGIAKLYVEAPQKRTFLDWLNTVGTGQGDNVQVRFIQGAGARATGTALRLTYTDGNRWSIVSEILELMGNATLEYYGLLQGTPTFFVHDYSELSILNKFYDTGEIFNTSYQKDFANERNVLEIRASDSVKGRSQTTNNTLSITIRPSPERPNRLGKEWKIIQGVEGITDIDTLLKYALSVYEEISSPKEAVDFEVHTSSFWLEVLVGQYVNIFGLPEGKKITEQINSITFTESTGITRIELADRLSLASAFLQARLKANSF
ncbi:hypothetical protein ASF71_10015 [Deinococcus sp. Leaf326]|nr:hypothetical protein ASF71_10015 [Deinococcus sp. Leaf326]